VSLTYLGKLEMNEINHDINYDITEDDKSTMVLL